MSFVRENCTSVYSLSFPFAFLTITFRASAYVTVPASSAITKRPESRAAFASIPVATYGTSGTIHGVACFCMLLPISERLASSCSRNGIIVVATEKACPVATSINSISFGSTKYGSPFLRTSTSFSVIFPFLSRSVAACAIKYFSSSSALRYTISSVTLPFFTRTYGVSIIPKSFKRACTARRRIRPMFCPSGV